MKKALEITLGIVTAVGGFLEMGSVATAAQAGAAFGYDLLWAILLGFSLWGEWPDPVTFAGISILVAAGLYTLYREQQLKRARTRI